MRAVAALAGLVLLAAAGGAWWAISSADPAPRDDEGAGAADEPPRDAGSVAGERPGGRQRAAPPTEAPPVPAKPPVASKPRAAADVDDAATSAALTPRIRPDRGGGDDPDGTLTVKVTLDPATARVTLDVPKPLDGPFETTDSYFVRRHLPDGTQMKTPKMDFEAETYQVGGPAPTLSVFARGIGAARQHTAESAAFEGDATLEVRFRSGGRDYTVVVAVPKLTQGRARRVEIRDAGVD